ncbi:MAG: BACON domain-containing protein [Bacteroidales bacterium]|nr:BACON domain-containing protein [Bacteroidales bacterium]
MFWKNISACCCALAVFAACSDDDYLQQDPVEDMENGVSLPLEPENVIDPLGDSFLVSYTCGSSWKLSVKGDWLKVMNEEGKKAINKGRAGTTVLRISADYYAGQDESQTRTATLTITPDTGEAKSFSFSQDKAFIEIDVLEHTLGWKVDTARFEVVSNIDWELKALEYDDFLVEYDGMDDEVPQSKDTTNVKFMSKINNLDKENDNTCSIELVPVKKDNKGERVDFTFSADALKKIGDHKVDILQEHLIFDIELIKSNELTKGNETKDDVANTLTLDTFSQVGAKWYEEMVAEGKAVDKHTVRQTVAVTYEKGLDWDWDRDALGSDVAKNDFGLVLVEDKYQTESETTSDGRDIEIRKYDVVVLNPAQSRKDSRSFEFDLYVEDDPTARKTVSLEQERYEFCVNVPEDLKEGVFAFENKIGGQNSFSVQTKGPWKVERKETDKDWIGVKTPEEVPASEIAGYQNSEITLSVPNKNLKFKQENASFIISSTLHDDIDTTIVCSQEEFVFEIEVDPILSSLPRKNVDSHSVTVTSSGDWICELDDNGKKWIDYTPAGEMGDSLTLRAKTHNPDIGNPRSSTITVKSADHEGLWNHPEYKDKAVKIFTFQQNAFTFNLLENISGKTDIKSLSKFAAIPDADDANNVRTFYLKCDAEWEIPTSTNDWFTVSETGGDGTKYKTITITANDNVGSDWSEPNDATIKVICDADGDDEKGNLESETKSFTITQDAFVFEVDFNGLPATIGSLDNGSKTFKVKTTKGAGYTVSSDGAWIFRKKGEKVSGTGNYDSFSFSPYQNGSLSERQAVLTVKSDNLQNEVKTFVLSQEPYVFDSEDYTLGDVFAELDADPQYVAFDCLGEYKVTSKPTWVTIGTESQEGSTLKLKVSVKDNTSIGSDREATVELQSTVADYPEDIVYTKKISLSQKDFVWNIFNDPETIEAKILGNDTHDLGFFSSGSWEIKSGKWNNTADAPMVGLDPVSGDGGRDREETVTIDVPDNYWTTDRTAEVALSSKRSTHKHSITITQPAYVFNTDDKVGQFTWDGNSEDAVVALNSTGTLLSPEKNDWVSGELSDERTVTVSVEPNYSLGKRKGELTVKSEHWEHNPALQHTITVNQDPYVFEPGDDPEQYTWDGGLKTVAFTSYGKLDSESIYNNGSVWLSGALTGDGKTVNVDVEPNYELKERGGKLTVKSEHWEYNPALQHTINVSQDAYVFESGKNPDKYSWNGGTQTVAFTSSGKLDPESIDNNDAAWLSGELTVDGETVNVKVGPNYSLEERGGKLTVRSEHWEHNPALFRIIYVSQEPYVFSPGKDPDQYTWNGGTQTVAFTSSGKLDPYSINNNGSAWLSGALTGDGKAVYVIVAPNYELDERKGALTVRSEHYEYNNDLFDIIYVSQAPYVFSVDDVDDKSFDSMSNPIKLVSYDDSGNRPTVEISSEIDWLGYQYKEEGIIAFNAEKNFGADPRTATVTIKSAHYDDNPKLFKQIVFTQEGYKFDVIPPEGGLEFDYGGGDNSDVTYTCDGSVRVGISPADVNWLSAVAEDGTVIIKVAPNSGKDERNCIVKVYSSENEDFYEEIPVTQSGYDFTLLADIKTQLENFSYLSIAKVFNNVWTCSGEVKIEENADWLSVEPYGSNGFKVSCTENTGMQPREAEFRIVSADFNDKYFEFTVIQAGKPVEGTVQNN